LTIKSNEATNKMMSVIVKNDESKLFRTKT